MAKEKMKVFIMGTGRMGGIIASGISDFCEVYVYDENEDKGREVAKETGCEYASRSKLNECDVLILALPPAVTAGALEKAGEYIGEHTVIINIATTVSKEDLKPVCSYPENLVGAKLVAHYREMGEEPVIVVDAVNDKGFATAKQIFNALGQVVPGDENQVEQINTLATREAFRAGLRIRKMLSEKGVAEEVINSAVRVVAAGSIKSYAYNDIGPFAEKLLAELEEEGF